MDLMLGAGKRSRFATESLHEMKGLALAAPEAARNLVAALRHVHERPAVNLDSKFETQVGAVGGKLGVYPRTVFGLLNIADEFFKDLGIGNKSGAVLFKLAYRKARAEGLEGDALSKRTAEIISAASNGDKSEAGLLKEIHQENLNRTFQEDPGQVVKDLIRWSRKHPGLDFIIPFKKTPANIAKISWQRSPLGLFSAPFFGEPGALKAFNLYRAALKSGAPAEDLLKLRGQASDAMGRWAIGLGTVALFGSMARSGMMTGGGPQDLTRRNNLKDKGWLPYSFHFGDRYIPYNRFEPMSSMLQVIADMADPGLHSATTAEKASVAASSFMKNMLNKAYMQGLTSISGAINDPDRYLVQWASGLAGSVIPAGVAATAHMIDPVSRDIKGGESGIPSIPGRIGRTLVSRIPFASESLDANTSSTGEEVQRPGTALERLASPAPISAEDPNADVQREWEKEKALDDEARIPPPPAREFSIPIGLRQDDKTMPKTVKLTRDEFAVLVKRRREAVAEFRSAIKDPSWAKASPEDKIATSNGIFSDFGKQARGEVLEMVLKRLGKE